MQGAARRVPRGSPDQVVGDLVTRVGVGILLRRGVGVDLQRDRLREDLLGLGQHLGIHQQVAAIELDHAQLPGVEFAQLRGGDVDALDLAAVLEVPGDVGRLVVEDLVLEQLLKLRARLAALARLFLAALLGFDPLLLFLLRAPRPGLAQVDLALVAALRRGLALALRGTLARRPALRRTRLAAPVLARWVAALGRGRRDPSVAELAAEAVGHGINGPQAHGIGGGAGAPAVSSAAAAVRCPDRRRARRAARAGRPAPPAGWRR